MQHLAAFFQNVDQGGSLLPLSGVVDQSLTVTGNDIRVPQGLSMLCGAAFTANVTTITQVQVQTPSLRDTAYYDVSPISDSGTFTELAPVSYFPQSPIPLVALEDLNLYSNTDDAAAQDLVGLIWLSDTPASPANGEIFTLRATSAVTLSAGSWVNGNITFGQVLPVGDYDIVGMRVEGGGLDAARIVVQGYPWRPGVIGRQNTAQLDQPKMRFGESGVLATFNNNTPPTIDCLGSGGTAQVIYLDLIKVG